MVRTSDGGATWTSQSSGTYSDLYGVSCPDANTCTAVGHWSEGGAASAGLRTTDGGATWTSQSSGTFNPLLGVCFTDTNTGAAVGLSATILRTTDGDATWTTQATGT